MSTAQKFIAGLVVMGVATALLLPGRQTVGVLSGISGLISGTEHTAITGNL